MSHEIENSIQGIISEISSVFQYDGWDIQVGRDGNSIAVCADAKVNRVYKIEIREIGIVKNE